MTHIIAVTSKKGGVGKTSAAVSLSSALANFAPTLLVDADDQGHVALSYGLPIRSGLHDWLVERLPLADCTLTGRPDSLTILPGDSHTKTVERLYNDPLQFIILKAALKSLPHKYVVIDTAAGGLLQEAAIAVADQIVIPFRPETLGIDGVYATMALVDALNRGARMTMLPVAYDNRLKEHRHNVLELVTEYGAAMMADPVLARIAVAEAVSVARTIWEHDAPSLAPVKVAYTQLVARVMRLANADVERIDAK